MGDFCEQHGVPIRQCYGSHDFQERIDPRQATPNSVRVIEIHIAHCGICLRDVVENLNSHWPTRQAAESALRRHNADFELEHQAILDELDRRDAKSNSDVCTGERRYGGLHNWSEWRPTNGTGTKRQEFRRCSDCKTIETR